MIDLLVRKHAGYSSLVSNLSRGLSRLIGYLSLSGHHVAFNWDSISSSVSFPSFHHFPIRHMQDTLSVGYLGGIK